MKTQSFFHRLKLAIYILFNRNYWCVSEEKIGGREVLVSDYHLNFTTHQRMAFFMATHVLLHHAMNAPEPTVIDPDIEKILSEAEKP